MYCIVELVQKSTGQQEVIDPLWPNDYNAWPKWEVASLNLCQIPFSGLTWLLYTCASLWRALSGASATERPIGTICKQS